MITGFDYMLETLGQSLIIQKCKDLFQKCKDLFLEIYQKCMKDTETNISKEGNFCNNYRANSSNVSFGIGKYGYEYESIIREQEHLRQNGIFPERLANFTIYIGKVTCNDFDKIKKTIIKKINDNKRSLYNETDEKFTKLNEEFVNQIKSTEEEEYVSKYFAQLIFSYYYELKAQLDEGGKFDTMLSSEEASYKDKLLELITRVIEICDYSHIFPDGNGRTLGFVLLNKFLIENNMWPTMIKNGWDMCLPISKRFADKFPTYADRIEEGQKYFIKQLIDFVTLHYNENKNKQNK